jgi:predicted RecA/RadA family phage recombinase
MEILSFSENGKAKSSKGSKRRAFIGIGVIAAALGLSSTLAANISINAGPVEFGQGVAQTVSCSGDESVIVTPATSFTNTPSSVSREVTLHGGDTITVSSTADISVGMLVSFGMISGAVVTDIDSGVLTISIGNLPDEITANAVFTPSSGTEQTVTSVLNSGNDGDYEVGTSSMVVDRIGLETGMLVSGPGIPTNTVVVLADRADGTYLELSKDTSYSSGELTFTNSGKSSFELSDITVSNIPDTCNGKVFTIKIYDNESSEPLKISNWDGGDSSVQVWWANGYQSGNFDPTGSNEAVVQFPTSYRVFFDNMSTAYNDDYAFETNSNNQSISTGTFKVNLPITVDASRVYKITVETQDDSDSLNLDEGGFSFYGFWQQFKMR